MIREAINIEVLKKHYPACARIFDQVASTKASEAEYKEFKAKCETEKVN
jgi:hypothetical protein